MTGAAVVGGLAAAFFNRDRITTGIFKAGTKLLERYGKRDAQLATLPIARGVSRLQWLTQRDGLHRLAVEQVAERRMRSSLVNDLGWSIDQAGTLFSSKRSVSHWTAELLSGGRGVLSGQPYAPLRNSLGKGTDAIYDDILRARNSAGVHHLHNKIGPDGRIKPFASDAHGDVLRNQLSQAKSQIERAYLQELRETTQSHNLLDTASGRGGWGNFLVRQTGARPLTLGEMAGMSGHFDKRTIETINNSMDFLGKLSRTHSDIGLNVADIPVAGVWRTTGGVHDLRGMQGMLGRWLNNARAHFQIPMVPYLKGFSPLQLFPWVGGESKEAINLLSYKNIGKQLGVKDLVGGRDLNIALVGRTAVGMQFGEGVTDAAGILGRGIVGLDARGGFTQRVLSNIYAAKEAAPAKGLRDWLGKQTDPSVWTRLRSVGNKYSWSGEGEPYPAEALRMLFAQESAAWNSPEAVGSVASFLRTSGSMHPDVLKKVFVPNAVADTDLLSVLTKLGSDDAVVDYFQTKAGQKGFHPVSENLSNLLHTFDNTQGSFRDSIHPRRARKLIDGGLFGDEDPRRGVDLMRDAIVEEYILGFPSVEVARGGSLFERVAGLTDVDDAARQEALSFVQGTVLQNTIRQQGFEAARDSLVSARGLRENAEYMVNNYLSRLDTHVPLPTDDLPHTFLVRGHHSLIGQINSSLKNGQGAIGSVYDLLSTGASRQYTRASVFGMAEPENFTTSSMPIYFFQERINRMLSEFGLGLGPRDMGSAASIAWGFFAKRAVPAFVGYEAYNYLNFEADHSGVLPSPKKLYANVRANLSLARARVFGSEHWDQLYPGLSDSVFGTVFNGSNTYEEQKEQLQSGYVPVKSHRFWLVGSRSEFTGEKIRYWLPDPYRRAHSGWESAENADVSSRDYWAHSVIPTPRYPLSPVMHFLDPYWWENKHSTGDSPDRPYVQSGPLFTPETPWGPILNATIGSILKPTRVLHPEYDPRSWRLRDGIDRVTSNLVAGTPGTSLISLLNDTTWDAQDAAFAANAENDASGSGFSLYSGSIARFKTAGGVSVEGVPGAGAGGSSGGRSARKLLSDINASLKVKGSHTTPLRVTDGTGPNVVSYTGNPNDVQYAGDLWHIDRSIKQQMGIYGWFADLISGSKPTGLMMDDSSRGYGLSARIWDQNIGGLGGELSEVSRRFLLKRPGTLDWYNPVPNAFWGSWLPGDGSYINVQRGDPYARLPQGIMRLPGEAYEKLHGVKLMQTRASSLGKTEDELVAQMLHMREPLDDFGEYVTELGNDLHSAVQNRWRQQGLLIAAEAEIYDDKLGASGHIDAVLQMNGKRYIGEVKTMSDKRFRSGKIFSEHLDQINFYMHVTDIKDGVLLYANRDNPGEVRAEYVKYSPLRQHLVERKVARARARVRELVESGQVPRAQLYDDVTRFEILADIAPYSDEFRALGAMLAGNDQLSDAQTKRVQAAKKRAAAQKKTVDIAPYHFTAGADLEDHIGVVRRVIDANTLQLATGKVVRLAGVKASNQRIDEYFEDHGEGFVNGLGNIIGSAIDDATGGTWGSRTLGKDRTPAERMFAKFGIVPGSPVHYMLSADEDEQHGDDMYRSSRAVLMSGVTNVNRALLSMGIAEERDTDWSAAGVAARFSDYERFKGGIWEKFSHLDTPLHTKFLRVRSAYEEYVRGNVYGKNTGGWESPVRDYIWPTVDAYVARNPIVAGVSMGLFASMFTPTKSAKLKVGSYAGLVGAGLSVLTHTKELVTGDKWIPGRVRERREIEEYYDILKYIKYRGLYEYASDKARSEEGVDIDKLIAQQEVAGEGRKRAEHGLTRRKARLKATGRGKEQIEEINKRLKGLSEYERDVNLGPWATQAVLYRQRYKSTMYGISENPTGDYRALMGALPKYEREIIAGILKDSTPQEKRKFYELLPDYQKRILGKYLGIEDDDLPERQSLNSYFRTHTLPGSNWAGWRPDVDLNMMKARAVVEEGLDPMEFGLYPQTIAKAEAVTQTMDVPTVEGRSSHISSTLESVLNGTGLRNTRVMVQVVPDRNAKSDSVSINMDISYDRHSDLVSALRG